MSVPRKSISRKYEVKESPFGLCRAEYSHLTSLNIRMIKTSNNVMRLIQQIDDKLHSDKSTDIGEGVDDNSNNDGSLKKLLIS